MGYCPECPHCTSTKQENGWYDYSDFTISQCLERIEDLGAFGKERPWVNFSFVSFGFFWREHYFESFHPFINSAYSMNNRKKMKIQTNKGCMIRFDEKQNKMFLDLLKKEKVYDLLIYIETLLHKEKIGGNNPIRDEIIAKLAIEEKEKVKE